VQRAFAQGIVGLAASTGLGDVQQGVGADITELRGVGCGTDAE
jgi:hypothetical protein